MKYLKTIKYCSHCQERKINLEKCKSCCKRKVCKYCYYIEDKHKCIDCGIYEKCKYCYYLKDEPDFYCNDCDTEYHILFKKLEKIERKEQQRKKRKTNNNEVKYF